MFQITAEIFISIFTYLKTKKLVTICGDISKFLSDMRVRKHVHKG